MRGRRNIVNGKYEFNKWLSAMFTALHEDVNTGCWVWTGVTGCGYGKLGKRSVHRFIYEAFRGKIPYRMCLDHLCLNKRCVNPYHLEIVTLIENSKRGGTNRRSRVPKR